MKKTGIIVGAGIIGSAVAYELSQRGVTDLLVVDADMEGSLSSTERNAGGVRHIWQQPINSELSRISIKLFEKIKTEVGFQQSGYLWLFSKEKQTSGQALFEAALSRGLDYEKWDATKIEKHYPFLDKLDDVAFALFGKKDGLLNSNAVKLYFQNQAKKKGAELWDRTWISDIQETSGGVRVKFERFDGKDSALKFLEDPKATAPGKTEEVEADFIVLCGGAWTKLLLEKLNVPSFTHPIRRQICLFKSETFDMTPYGMVVDTSGIYFHPEGGNILAGLVLKKEPEGFKFNSDPDFFETHIWPTLYERSSQMERLKYVTGWGGLYSYTPDTTGILGRVTGFKHIFEAHSFTGRGVMQSYGAAVAITDLITKSRFETFDASSLSRDRFEKGAAALLPEGLHI